MDNNTFSPYEKKIHNFGLFSSILLIILLAGVPLSIQLISGVTPDRSGVLVAMGGAAMTFVPVAIIEFLSYTPIIGAGGMYMSFITGNIMNMKLPAAQSGLKLSGAQPGSKEADVVSVLSIGVSSLVTTAILFLGLLLVSQLMPVLSSPTLAPAFNNLMPAIMGALLVPRIKATPKLAIVPCAVAIVITLFKGYAWITAMQTYLLPVFLILSVAWAYFLYKQGGKKQSGESK